MQDALHRNLPIVSLETAITSHGLPYNEALSTASSLESIIQKAGAVPATIGLIDGVVKVGLSEADIERLANPEKRWNDNGKWKVGRRDIAPAMTRKVDGGTTVSATSFLSALVGIDIFVTGWAFVYKLENILSIELSFYFVFSEALGTFLHDKLLQSKV